MRRIAIMLLLLAGGTIVNILAAWAQNLMAMHRMRQWMAIRVYQGPHGQVADTSDVDLSAYYGTPFSWLRRELMFGESGVEYLYAIRYDGLIVNTLVYALLLWLIFFAPFAARRALRRRRGTCEKCAYPIGTSPVCTECGAAVVAGRPESGSAAS